MKKMIILATLVVAATFSVAAQNVVISGNFESGVKWTLYNNGSFVVTGSGGGMEGFSEKQTGLGFFLKDKSPWYNYSSNIKTVTIGAGITHIGVSNFYNCANLTSVTLHDGLKIIFSDAFYGCRSLTSITLPASINRLETSVFDGSGITTLVVKATTPPAVVANTFLNMPAAAIVYVPNASVADYKAHAIWGKLNIRRMSDYKK